MLLIVENCPVQYRAPFYAEIEQRFAGGIKVIYQSEGAAKPKEDKEFGTAFAWDIPLLEGYSFSIANDLRGQIRIFIETLRSDDVEAVLLTDFQNRISLTSMLLALLMGVPLWMRMETQDEAYPRGQMKNTFRTLVYRLLYSTFSRAFSFGILNRKHLKQHGFENEQLADVPYIVANPLRELSQDEKWQRRTQIRNALNVSNDQKVVAFIGKLIPKKNPFLLLKAYSCLPATLQERIHFLFVGAGELEPYLVENANNLGCNVSFTGFINQSKIHDYYLATDILCLPSLQMGEVWGLAINEGLQAGCSVICSQYVGCSVEFQEWDRVKVVESDNEVLFAECLIELLSFENDFEWCAAAMRNRYSMESASIEFVKAARNWGIQSAERAVSQVV